MPRNPSCRAAPIQCRDRNALRIARRSRSLSVNHRRNRKSGRDLREIIPADVRRLEYAHGEPSLGELRRISTPLSCSNKKVIHRKPLLLARFGKHPFDAEREGLHVEVEAADRAASEQFERPGPRSGARAVRRGGLKVSAGPARLRNRRCRGGYAVRNRAGAARVPCRGAGQSGEPGGPGLRVDPRGTEAPPARDAATAVGGVQRRARRRGLPAQRLLPDLPGVGRSG